MSIQDSGGTKVKAMLTTAAILDFEAVSEYTVGIKMVDRAGLEVKAIIEVKVINVNDPPQV